MTKVPCCLNYLMEDRIEAHKLAGIGTPNILAKLCKQLALESSTCLDLITRSFININDRNTPINCHPVTAIFNKSTSLDTIDESTHLYGLHGGIDSHTYYPSSIPSTFTVMQWNVLSQSKCQCSIKVYKK